MGEGRTIDILAAALLILARATSVLGIKVAVLARIAVSLGGEA